MRYLLLLTLLVGFSAKAQNLNDERIWKIPSKKKAIYLTNGVFHQNSGPDASVIGIRSSGASQQGYERVVIDFSTSSVPKLYGHINETERKISVDFFQTSIASNLKSLSNTRYVKSVDFLVVDKDQVTMQMNLKSKYSFDIFFLENPGRLVIDIRQ
jgi:hypothetical protein